MNYNYKQNNITDDDIKRATELKNAVDGLGTSLTNVNTALPKFADGMNAGLKAIAEKLPEVVAAMTNLNIQNKELINNGQKPINLFGELTKSLFSWNNLVSVGITLLATYSATIIDWIAEMLKGKTNLTALGQAMKDNAIIMNGVVQTRQDGAKAAQRERTELEVLYRSATRLKTNSIEQKQAIDALKRQWPDTFAKLTAETAATNDTAKAYENLKAQINAAAFAEAAKNKITQNAGRIIDDSEGIRLEREKNIALRNELNKAKRDYNVALNLVSEDEGRAAADAIELQRVIKMRLAESDKKIYAFHTDAKLLKTQNEKLYSYVDENIKKYGVPSEINRPHTKSSTNKNNTKEKLRTPGKELEDAKFGGFQPAKDAINQDLQQTLDAEREIKVKNAVRTEEEIQKAQADYIKDAQEKIDQAEQADHHSKALQQQIDLLQFQHDIAVDAAQRKGEATTDIEAAFAKKKAKLEDDLMSSKVHAGDKFIDAALKNSKKDSAIFKAAFLAKKATSIADTVISTKRAVMESLKAYAGIPFIGQALGIAQAAFMGAQGASSIAEIAKQKPGFAKGGRYSSDGKGALLPGYSNFDDTNAYLRSGEAVVVSEAMRNPWARNLVSAINVAYGGRDFSIANPGTGYAIGGIFTDGGNANRYYNQPVNDQQALANSIAYQMVNNFPPIYVDVKDINTQQGVLARTVDRVNL